MTPNYNMIEDNVNDNNINESNTNAEVSSMVMVGLGGRNLERFKRSSDLLKQGSAKKIFLNVKFYLFIYFLENLHSTIWDQLQLVMRSHSTTSLSCLETLFCETSEISARRGGFSQIIAEMSSLLLSKQIPNLKPVQRKRLVLAGKYGRNGVNCTEIYDECEDENRNFINIVDAFKWSPVADLKSIEKLITWAYNKK